MQDYGTPVFPQLIAPAGEVLVATPEAKMLEGTTDGTWSVVVRFPDMDALNGWYLSEEYQAVPTRRRELTGGDQSFLLAAPQFQGLPNQKATATHPGAAHSYCSIGTNAAAVQHTEAIIRFTPSLP